MSSCLLIDPVELVRKETLMKTELQHLLNPLNLWSRFGGNFTQVFKLYETYCWNLFLRKWLTSDAENRS